MKEIWTDVNGYDGKYEVSNLGRIRSNQPRYVINKGYVNKSGYLMKPMDNGRGYKYVFFSGKGFRDRQYIHRIVAFHFLKETYKKGMEVNHIDGDKSNNSVANLEWLTPLENKKHAIRTGLIDQKGSNSCKTNLTDLQALAIKRLYNNKLLTSGEIMEIFGVNRHTVLNISSGKTFDYLD